jgi:hypothetical protein
MLPVAQAVDPETANARPATSPLAAADAAFLTDFESLRLPADAFSHRQHVRLAWALLRTDPAGPLGRVERGIRRFAGHHGAPAKYHATVTEAWMRLVAGALASSPAAAAAAADEPFDAWVHAAPELLDSGRLRLYFSEVRLASAEARAGWVEPDLGLTLPAIALSLRIGTR